MAKDAIPQDSTLATIRSTVPNLEKLARVVLGTMLPCKREHGNAQVRIGITGEGKSPYHKVTYLDATGAEVMYGSFAGRIKDEKYQVHELTWSTSAMTFGEVEDLIGSITGYQRKSADHA